MAVPREQVLKDMQGNDILEYGLRRAGLRPVSIRSEKKKEASGGMSTTPVEMPKKPEYDITKYLNTNKPTPPVNASFGMSKAPEVVRVPNVRKPVAPKPVAPVAPKPVAPKPVAPKINPVAPTFSAQAKKEVADIGGKMKVIPKKRVLTEKQASAMAKLKEMGARNILMNKMETKIFNLQKNNIKKRK